MEIIELIFSNIKNIFWLIFALALLIVAIKITFTFNINEYLKIRKGNIDNKIRNCCPHAHISIVDNKVIAESSFVSPVGTTNYICERCRSVIYVMDKESEKQRIEKLVKNFDGYIKQEKKFKKLLRKGGYI